MIPRCWGVMVWVLDKYCGLYECDSKDRAEKLAEKKRDMFGVLGCKYVVKPVCRLYYIGVRDGV